MCASSSILVNQTQRGWFYEHFYQGKPTIEAHQERIAFKELQSQHNIHLLYGLSFVGGYDSLSIFRYKQLLDTIVSQVWSKHTRDQIYDLSNPLWTYLGLGKVISSPEALKNFPDEWRNVKSHDRYYLTNSFIWKGRFESEYSSQISWQQSKLAEKYNQPLVPTLNESFGSVKIVSYENHKVVLEVNCLKASMLASSENHFPGWTATINGVPKKIELWLGTFRSIWLEKGKYQVVFEFRPSHYTFSSIITCIGLFIFTGLLIFYFFKDKEDKLV
jgi:hypothetical protein